MLRVRARVRYVGEVRKILAAAAAMLLISACGSYVTGSSPTPTPSSGPGLNFDVMVTEKDRAASLRVGQTLQVVLHANSGMNNWAQVRSSNEAILTPTVNPAATAVRGVTLAAFKAIATGEADVTAYASPDCPPGQACPAYVQVLTIKVTVSP
jgi:phage tail protein X